MRNYGVIGIIGLFLLASSLSFSCSRKSGCPAYENVHAKPDRKGNLSTKGGSSNLFPKKMRNSMK